MRYQGEHLAMTQPIFLVGPRGCGKTTVGLELARVSQSQFVDTDHWLQTQARQTIAEIVEKEGWESFRARESDCDLPVRARVYAGGAPGSIPGRGATPDADRETNQRRGERDPRRTRRPVSRSGAPRDRRRTVAGTGRKSDCYRPAFGLRQLAGVYTHSLAVKKG